MASTPNGAGIATALTLLLLAGCGSGSDPEPAAGVHLSGAGAVASGSEAALSGVAAASGPSSVAGTWSPLLERNPAAPRLAGCTGEVRALEGLAPSAAGVPCAAAPSSIVTQSGASFAITPEAIACGGGRIGVRGGRGGVTGDTIDGQIDLAVGEESQIRFFTGGVAGNQLTLSVNRLELSGLRSGSCLISPPLVADVTITP